MARQYIRPDLRSTLLAELVPATTRLLINPTWDDLGWLRVYVDDGNRLVFVDEIQSDSMETPRQMGRPGRSSEIEDALCPWNLHGFASVREWAQALGYAVGVHSEASRDRKPGMTKSPRKWNLYYAPVIKLFDLKSDSVLGYPAPIMTDRHIARTNQNQADAQVESAALSSLAPDSEGGMSPPDRTH